MLPLVRLVAARHPEVAQEIYQDDRSGVCSSLVLGLRWADEWDALAMRLGLPANQDKKQVFPRTVAAAQLPEHEQAAAEHMIKDHGVVLGAALHASPDGPVFDAVLPPLAARAWSTRYGPPSVASPRAPSTAGAYGPPGQFDR